MVTPPGQKIENFSGQKITVYSLDNSASRAREEKIERLCLLNFFVRNLSLRNGGI